MQRDDLKRALSAFPQFQDQAKQLINEWPGCHWGFHRLFFEEGKVSLTLLVGEAAVMLAQLVGQVDCWFLDGFAPDRNPDMWVGDLYQAIADKSAPGATLATFTAAGHVRRGLAEVGFEVERIPGFGRKRHMIAARYPGQRNNRKKPGDLSILGAGIAGLSTASAANRRGIGVQLIDPFATDKPAGPPAAVISPHFAKLPLPQSWLSSSATCFAERFYEGPHWHRTGKLQLARYEDDVSRFQAIAAQPYLTPDSFRLVEVSDLPPHIRSDWTALQYDHGGWLGAGDWLTIKREEFGLKGDGEGLHQIVDCRGMATDGLDLRALAGQMTLFDGVIEYSDQPTTGPVQFINDDAGQTIIGSSFVKLDQDRWKEFSASATGRKEYLAKFSQIYPDIRMGEALRDWGGVRANLPGHQPAVGRISERRSVLTGLGARGFTLAPLLAEALISNLCGEPLPIPKNQWQMLNPRRAGVMTL